MPLLDRLPQLSEPVRAAIVRAMIYIGMILALAYLAEQSGWLSDAAPIAVAMDMPAQVTLIRDADSIAVPVVVRIKNNSGQAASLEAPSTCHIFRWFVSSPEGEFIQAEANETCTQVAMTANLPAGGLVEEAMQIDLDPKRLAPGTTYILSFRFWGQDGQARFTAITE